MKHLNSETLKNILDTMPAVREGRQGLFARVHRKLVGDPYGAIGKAAGAANRSRVIKAVLSREKMLKNSAARNRKGIAVRTASKKK